MHEWLDISEALREMVKGAREWPTTIRPEIVVCFIELLIKNKIVPQNLVQAHLVYLKSEIENYQAIRKF